MTGCCRSCSSRSAATSSFAAPASTPATQPRPACVRTSVRDITGSRHGGNGWPHSSGGFVQGYRRRRVRSERRKQARSWPYPTATISRVGRSTRRSRLRDLRPRLSERRRHFNGVARPPDGKDGARGRGRRAPSNAPVVSFERDVGDWRRRPSQRDCNALMCLSHLE